MEILRFVVVGAGSTIIDYGVHSVTGFLLKNVNISASLNNALCVAAGFIVSVIFNYILSSIWVYKNVDKSVNKKSPKAMALFLFLSICGLFIGIGLWELGAWKVNMDLGIINLNSWTDGLFTSAFSFVKFFWFTYFFAFKTLITLVWNYITRKLFIFKAPKEK
ncbi:MAG: GtrA family protein [Bacilli bacterium]|nr:GtrA family protein [Bacilli bacterium]